ncbi:MAG: hypothetical protein AB7O62_00625 [Pirellulales bacterium]
MDDASSPPPADRSSPMSASQYADHMRLQGGIKTAKILGIACVVYSSLGLMMAMCCGLSSAGIEAMVRQVVTQMQTAQQQFKQAYEQELADLEEQINAADDDEEKRALRDSREAMIQSQPLAATPPSLNELTAVLASPKLKSFSAIEILSGVVLNLAMLATGIGLIQRKRWGRVGTCYVSVLKVARLLLLYLPFMFVIWPGWVRELSAVTEKMVEETQKNNPAAAAPPAGVPTPKQMAQQVSLTVYVYGVMWACMMVVLSPILPGILLWLLRRPNVVAACHAAPTLAME